MEDQKEQIVQEAPTEEEIQKFNQFYNTLLAEQDFAKGILAGIASAIFLAFVWLGFSIVTGITFGIVAIGVGYGVGYAIQIMGKGVETKFGILGAICSAMAVLLGDGLIITYYYLQEAGNSEEFFTFQEFLPELLNPLVTLEIMYLALVSYFDFEFDPMYAVMSLVFLGFAIYYAYYTSMNWTLRFGEDN